MADNERNCARRVLCLGFDRLSPRNSRGPPQGTDALPSPAVRGIGREFATFGDRNPDGIAAIAEAWRTHRQQTGIRRPDTGLAVWRINNARGRRAFRVVVAPAPL